MATGPPDADAGVEEGAAAAAELDVLLLPHPAITIAVTASSAARLPKRALLLIEVAIITAPNS
ncbi:MAG: hypothetical protein ABI323_03200 [Solirubrobacteraceae bacterium]